MIRKPTEKEGTLIKNVLEIDGHVLAVYLNDGIKIGITREGDAAYLKVGSAPIIKPAEKENKGDDD